MQMHSVDCDGLSIGLKYFILDKICFFPSNTMECFSEQFSRVVTNVYSFSIQYRLEYDRRWSFSISFPVVNRQLTFERVKLYRKTPMSCYVW